MLAYPAMKLGLVDVRDAAKAHILAMKDGRGDGQRILITAGALSFQQIANILREEFGKQGEGFLFKTKISVMDFEFL